MVPRPTSRIKYSPRQFLLLAQEHFQDAPRCSNGEFCMYGETGCAVGFALTYEDAAIFDGKQGDTSVGQMLVAYPDIYSDYFGNIDIEMLHSLQVLHDYKGDNWRNNLLHGIKMYLNDYPE